jgi:cyclohexyl-isocyanide hydratase
MRELQAPLHHSCSASQPTAFAGLNRRELVRRAVGAALSASSVLALAAEERPAGAAPVEKNGAGELPSPSGTRTAASISKSELAALGIPDGPPQQIAMLIYPQMTALDLVGPLQVLAGLGNVEVHLVWKEKTRPVMSDAGMPIMPTRTFAECPDQLTVLLAPGGALGTLAVMQDEAVLDFVAEKGKTAKWITSVCTGSLILGAAGLLEGYRATSHWAMRDTVLPLLGAVPVKARVVEDRNRMTGGGVTAGIDFGLRLAAKLRTERMARAIQLSTEYDPQPPFHAGSPEEAGDELTRIVLSGFGPLREQMSEAARKARTR